MDEGYNGCCCFLNHGKFRPVVYDYEESYYTRDPRDPIPQKLQLSLCQECTTNLRMNPEGKKRISLKITHISTGKIVYKYNN